MDDQGPDLRAQLPWLLSGGLLGLGLVVFGAALVIVHNARVDRSRLEVKLDELVDAEEADSEGNGDEFPAVAYSLLIGLDPTQEASLFRDINGEHKGMDVTHLDSISPAVPVIEKSREITNWVSRSRPYASESPDSVIYCGTAPPVFSRLSAWRLLYLK